MSKDTVFTMKLEADLRAAFMAEAEANHRPASQIVRELMRDYVQKQRQSREYEAFVQGKVNLARKQIDSQQFVDNDEVESRFATLRAAAETPLDPVSQ